MRACQVLATPWSLGEERAAVQGLPCVPRQVVADYRKARALLADHTSELPQQAQRDSMWLKLLEEIDKARGVGQGLLCWDGAAARGAVHAGERCTLVSVGFGGVMPLAAPALRLDCAYRPGGLPTPAR